MGVFTVIAAVGVYLLRTLSTATLPVFIAFSLFNVCLIAGILRILLDGVPEADSDASRARHKES